MFQALDISTTGMVAQRHRMDSIASNIANINTTQDAQGQPAPFQRRLVEFQAAEEGASPGRGVGVRFEVRTDANAEPRKVYSPGHPDADAEGIVRYPNIELVTEFVNALEASRAYEANIAAVETTKSMQSQTLRILA